MAKQSRIGVRWRAFGDEIKMKENKHEKSQIRDAQSW